MTRKGPHPPQPPRPTVSELAIMRVLWERGPSTVREVLENLVESYPSLRNRIFEGDDLPQFLNVFIDGTDVRLNQGLETPVAADATVILLPAVAGGQQVTSS